MTPTPSRAATQTPWIIYVPVTQTPEPVTVTPLPSITSAVRASASRTPTKVGVAATKVAVAATATKPAAASGPVAPPPTAAPACTASAAPKLYFPENGVSRNTRKDGSGGDAFIFKWEPFSETESDTQLGYQISMTSRRGTTTINGATVYVSHNKFLQDGKQYIYDQRAVSSLAGGEPATVSWQVSVVKTSGGFDKQGGISGSVVTCSPPSLTYTIRLLVPDS